MRPVGKGIVSTGNELSRELSRVGYIKRLKNNSNLHKLYLADGNAQYVKTFSEWKRDHFKRFK